MLKSDSKLARPRFTLVEVMLVAVVIMILASLLLPILSRAPKYAREVVCINNMRQICIGYRTYMNENNGIFPIPQYWLDDLRPPYPYVQNFEVFKCPATDTIVGTELSDLASPWDIDLFPTPENHKDYHASGDIKDVEKRGNFNNGHGNNVYNFDPSNKNPAVPEYIASKETRKVLYEFKHSNHFRHRMNMMYIQEVQHVFNTQGMAYFYILDDRGYLDYREGESNPYWP